MTWVLGNLDLIGRQLAAKKAGVVGERRIGVIPYAAPALMPYWSTSTPSIRRISAAKSSTAHS